MARIRTLVADAEPRARATVRSELAADPDIEIVAECEDGVKASRQVEQLSPELVVLDTRIPPAGAFGLLDAVEQERRPLVIFLSDDDSEAARAFDAGGLDYLVKPVDPARLRKAIARARSWIAAAQASDLARRLMTVLGTAPPAAERQDRIAVRDQGRVVFVRTDEIDRIEAAGNYLRLHAGPRTYIVRDTMNDMERRLDPARFVRIHRSDIVNLDRIRELQPHFNGSYRVVLRDGTRLMLTRNYRDRLQARLGRAL